MARRSALIVLSLAVHAAFAVGIGQIEVKKLHAATAIAYAEAKKKTPPVPAKIDPTPPPKSQKAPLSRRAAAPAADAAPPPPSKTPAQSALADAPDFGLSLSGGVNGTGIALPAPGAGLPASAPQRVARKLVPAAVLPSPASDCADPPSRPRPRGAIPQPAFTDAARAAGVSGKVRVQLTIDETGRVVDVKLLQGLGYGLDEAALAAARQASFEPALHCGVPERATFNIAMRFSL